MKFAIILAALALATGAHATHDDLPCTSAVNCDWPKCVQDCVATDYKNPCTAVISDCASDCPLKFVESDLKPLCMLCSEIPEWNAYCQDMGYCFYGMSTVSVLKTGSASESETKKIRDLNVGDKILARGQNGKAEFKEVKALPHSKAREDYKEIKMGKGNAESIRATLHHTFPTCSGKSKMAKDIKSGDCLLTPGGKGYVHKVEHVTAKKGDITYTIEMEAGTTEVAVGGVFFHAKTVATNIPLWAKKAF